MDTALLVVKIDPDLDRRLRLAAVEALASAIAESLSPEQFSERLITFVHGALELVECRLQLARVLPVEFNAALAAVAPDDVAGV